MNLKNKLLDLKKEISIMQKNKEGYGYKYVTEDSILLTINDKMIENGIKLTPMFVPNTLHSEVINYIDKKGKNVTDIIVRAEMKYTWEDVNTGEVEIIDWALLGQQSDASQALGSALTYANRYFLLKYFNIATSDDDPDKIRSEIEKEEERKKLSAMQTKIKKTLDKLIKKYQTQEKIYQVLGTTKEQFKNDYNNPDKWQPLLEQMELVLEDNSKIKE